MLYLDNPVGALQGVVVYRDHADRNSYYYAAQRPRIARVNGRPSLSFLKYKRDITDNPDFTEGSALGGGVLTFTVDLGLSESARTQIIGEIASREGVDEDRINLSPVQYKSGEIRLSWTAAPSGDGETAGGDDDDAQPLPFVKSILGPKTPSLFGDNRATFTMVLTQEGATLVEEAFRQGVSPFGVIYDLKAMAMRPAFDVVIRAQYQRIYNHFESHTVTRTRRGRHTSASEVSQAIQRLRESGDVEIEVTHFTDADDLKTKADEAVKWFQNEVLKDFFKSALSTPKFMDADVGALVGKLDDLLGKLQEVQTGASATPQSGTPAAQGSGQTAPAPTDLSSGQQSLAQLNQALVQLASQGQDEERQQLYSLRTLSQDELRTRTFRYSMRAAVEWSFGAQGQFNVLVQGMSLDDLMREVDLDDDFFKRLLVDYALVEELKAEQGVAAVGVELRYPADGSGTDPGGFVFKPADGNPTQSYKRFLTDDLQLAYGYRYDVHFAADSPWQGVGSKRQVDWTVEQARNLLVNPLDGIGLLQIDVALDDLDAERVRQVKVELRYEDAANGVDLSHGMVLAPGAAGQVWKLRLSDPTQRAFSYRATYALHGGGEVVTAWAEQSEPALLIGSPFAQDLSIRVFPMLSPDDLLEAILTVHYEEPDFGYSARVERTFTPDSLDRTTVTIPALSSPPRPYRYDVAVVTVSGDEITHSEDGVESNRILLREGASESRRVTVRLTDTDLSSAGLVAVRVVLTGPGEDPDTEEVFFTPSDTEPRQVWLAFPGEGAFEARFEVEGFDRQAQRIEGASGATSREALIGLPQR